VCRETVELVSEAGGGGRRFGRGGIETDDDETDVVEFPTWRTIQLIPHHMGTQNTSRRHF